MSKDIIIQQAPARILKGFAQVENVVALSQTLSFKAKGLYSSLSAFAMQSGNCWPDRETLAKLGQCHPNSVDKIVKELVAVGVITVKRQGLNKPNIYILNDVLTDEMIRKLKPYINPDSQGSVNPLNSTDSHYSVTPDSHHSVNQDSHHSVREEEEKNNNNKKPRKRKQRVYEEDSKEMKLVDYFIQRIQDWKPDYKAEKVNRQKWADEFRKMLELDGLNEREIEKVIDWISKDDFEQVNVMSPVKLRKRWEQLHAKMKRDERKAQRFGAAGAGFPEQGQKNRAYVVPDAAQTKAELDALFNY